MFNDLKLFTITNLYRRDDEDWNILGKLKKNNNTNIL